MKSIAVFCGSSEGNLPIYSEQAAQVGTYLAKQGIRLVYGGGKNGLMGVVANAALQAGGEVLGVIPHFMAPKEVAHKGLSQLLWVDSMHERKQKMFEISDGFIAMPGGFGTLDELFEIVTWAQLGLHRYPIGLLNVQGYFNPLLQFADQIVAHGFTSAATRSCVLHAEEIDALIQIMKAYQYPEGSQWLKHTDQT
ncbi:TIGR00730 family Rossman fold protein [Cytophagales bacterium LB-30]|uniref:Cytokinin riboside 5'-monophosphate phosphoribohydrolase n=1 Tax=Shiella aurantiaca TaxID=3058365 RepID=A0ABT8F8T0_9BACT|nr:TIGR00730 family Rossman fold protein [Shiella aurantiaca]MDN4166887.1 TIGR00730 family Rossman fold protein [Shiella aurantiaca]